MQYKPVFLKKILYNNYNVKLRTVLLPQHIKTNRINNKSKKSKIQSWLIQCSSFKSMKQAQSVYILSLVGINSQILSNNGWNRILLCPYLNLTDVDKNIHNVRNTKILTCIPISPHA